MPPHRREWALGACLILVLAVPALSPAAAPPTGVARTDDHSDALPPGVVARLGTLRLWHNATIASIAFSPDGRIVASGGGITWTRTSRWGSDGVPARRICLWERATGKMVRELLAPPGVTHCLAFSPNGRTLAASSQEVWLYDVATGKVMRRFPRRVEGIRSLAFLPDGKTLAAGQWERRLFLWNLAESKPPRVLRAWHDGHSTPGSDDVGNNGRELALSPDGKLAAWRVGKARGEERYNQG
jgi:WD40 repeat protein